MVRRIDQTHMTRSPGHFVSHSWRSSVRLIAASGMILCMYGVAGADGWVQLEADGQDRYVPVIIDGGSTSLLADIDSITFPAVSPDGEQVAFAGVVEDGSFGRYALFLVDTDGANLQQVTTGSFGEFDPAWTPDGSALVYSQNPSASILRSSCCRLGVFDLATGETNELTGNVGAIRPAISPDAALVSYDNPQGVWTVPFAGGTPVLRVVAGYDSHFSPDGSSLAYVINTGGLRRIRTIELASGVVSTLYSTSGNLEAPTWVGGRIYFVHHTGSGYDSRSNTELRSISVTGADLRTHSAFGKRRVGFDVFDNDEILMYNASSGLAETFDVAPDSSFGTPLQSGAFSVGWDSITGVDLDGDGHDEIFFYRPTDGLFKYYLSDGDGSLGALLSSGNYSLGWDSIATVDVDGDHRDEMLFYRPSDGVFKYYRTKPDGSLGTLLSSGNYSLGWDSITKVDLDGDGIDEFLFYRQSDGVYKYYLTKPNGSLGTLLGSGTYSTGENLLSAIQYGFID